MKVRCIPARAAGHELSHGEGEPGRTLHEVGEVLPRDADGDGLVEGAGAGGALGAFDDGHVADEVALAGDIEDDFLAVAGNVVELHATFQQEEDALGGLARGEEELARFETALAEEGNESIQILIGKDVHELRQLAQIPSDGALERRAFPDGGVLAGG